MSSKNFTFSMTTNKRRHSSVIPQKKIVTNRNASVILDYHNLPKHDRNKCPKCIRISNNRKRNSKILPKIENKLNLVQTPTKQKKTIVISQTNEKTIHKSNVDKSKNELIKLPIEPSLEVTNKKHKNIDFLFSELRDIDGPYHLDGNSKMYSPEYLLKRMKLKFDEKVKKSINEFLKLYNFEKTGLLNKYEYIKTNSKIAFLLRPEFKKFENYDKLKKLLEEDWLRDSKGKQKINYTDVFDSIFEMIDIWTDGVEADEYISLIHVLKVKFVMEEQENQKIYEEIYQ